MTFTKHQEDKVKQSALSLLYQNYCKTRKYTKHCPTKIVSMIRKYHNYKLQTNLWHREEEPHNIHKTPGRQSKATSSLFSIKMIAKLERTQSTAQRNMKQTQDPHNGSNNKQRIYNYCNVSAQRNNPIKLTHVYFTFLINPYNHSVHFMGHWQAVQTQNVTSD